MMTNTNEKKKNVNVQQHKIQKKTTIISTNYKIHWSKTQLHFYCLSHCPVDLNRLYEDVKRYSCTPRNYSVNLREELRATNAVFFPRCLLVKRCGGNCGCGTDNWNSGCTCQAAKTTLKLHEVGRITLKLHSQTLGVNTERVTVWGVELSKHHSIYYLWVLSFFFRSHPVLITTGKSG